MRSLVMIVAAVVPLFMAFFFFEQGNPWLGSILIVSAVGLVVLIAKSWEPA